MAQTKAQKKFERKHLSGVLKRRKEFAKVKQRQQLRAKQKAKRAAENEDNDAVKDAPATRVKNSHKALENIRQDDFFDEELDVLKHSSNGHVSKGSSTKQKRIIDGDSNTEAHDLALGDDTIEEDRDEVAAHREELKALAEKDPEFFKYLKENDRELLDFAHNSNFPEIDQLSEDEDIDTAPKDTKPSQGAQDLETATVSKWAEAMREKHSLRAMREVMLAFRAAAYANEEDERKTYKYTFSNAEVYHQLLLCALRQIPEVLNFHVPSKESSTGKVHVPESKKFGTLTSAIKSHATSLHHLLGTLSDTGTIRTALSSILALLPYLLSFKKVIRELVRSVIELWADASQDEATRIAAFLVLRRLCVIGDAGIKENTLRTTYQGLLKGSRNTSIHTLSAINLMKNSAVELWGLPNDNTAVSYTTGFAFIRALAIHLRASIKHNANEAYKTVYNWQYIHALDFWSRVLSTHCDTLRVATLGRPSPLHPLIYPLVQVTLGAARLIPTAAYFPLRFHCLRALIRLSSTTNTFIPLASPIYEVFQSAELRHPPHPSTLKPLDFSSSLRASKAYLGTRVYQDGVGDQALELLADFFLVWAKNIAFPELTLPVIVLFKRWLKTVSSPPAKDSSSKKSSKSHAIGNRNNRLTSAVALLLQKLESHSKFITDRRAKVEFAPNNRAGVEGFLKEVDVGKTPLGAFVEGQRKTREEKRKVLEEGRKADEKQREKEKARGSHRTNVKKRDAMDEDEDIDFGDDDSEDDRGEGLDGKLAEDEDDFEDDFEDEMELDDAFEDEDDASVIES